jgi:hypothetical protein
MTIDLIAIANAIIFSGDEKRRKKFANQLIWETLGWIRTENDKVVCD